MGTTNINIKKSELLEKKDVSKKSFDFLNLRRESLSEKYYQNVLAYDLILKQNYKSIMQLPGIEKGVVNTTSKVYITDKKHIVFTLAALELISGQKPQLTYAKKSIANFKVREHQIIGCKVTLRGNQIYSFLDKLSKILFPRIRDYSKKKSQSSQFTQSKKHCFLNKKSSQLVTWSFGFQNLMIFPELENHYELVDNFRGMDLSFSVSNSNSKTCRLLLSGFQLPFLS